MLQAGQLRHPIRFLRPLDAEDSQGGPRPGSAMDPEGWATFYRAWAAIEPMRGRVVDAADQVLGETVYRIRVRYRAGLRDSMRIVEDRGEGRHFQIVNIQDPDGKRRELHVQARQVSGWTASNST